MTLAQRSAMVQYEKRSVVPTTSSRLQIDARRRKQRSDFDEGRERG